MASVHLLGVGATAVADSERRRRYKEQEQIQACPCTRSTLVRCMIEQQMYRVVEPAQEKTLHIREFHSHVLHVAAEGLRITLCSRRCCRSASSGDRLIRRPTSGHNVTRKEVESGDAHMFASCRVGADVGCEHPQQSTLVETLVIKKRSFVCVEIFHRSDHAIIWSYTCMYEYTTTTMHGI